MLTHVWTAGDRAYTQLRASQLGRTFGSWGEAGFDVPQAFLCNDPGYVQTIAGGRIHAPLCSD
jgi:hypothetical protein